MEGEPFPPAGVNGRVFVSPLAFQRAVSQARWVTVVVLQAAARLCSRLADSLLSFTLLS